MHQVKEVNLLLRSASCALLEEIIQCVNRQLVGHNSKDGAVLFNKDRKVPAIDIDAISLWSHPRQKVQPHCAWKCRQC